jgi:hypothetical protein
MPFLAEFQFQGLRETAADIKTSLDSEETRDHNAGVGMLRSLHVT